MSNGEELASVLLHQPARGAGYRANVDAFHLARFAAGGSRHRVRVAFDLGAGAGAVGLGLLALGAAEKVVFVEIDENAAALAEKNLAAHGWTSRGTVIHADVAGVCDDHAGAAQLIVCNPPYVEAGRGRPPPEPRRARARMGRLETFVIAARKLAGRRAKVCFVYPAGDLATLVALLRKQGLEPKRLQAVHSSAASKARIVLIESQPAKPGGLAIEPPIVERAR